MARAEARAVYAPCFWLCLIAFLLGARYARAKFSPHLQFMRLQCGFDRSLRNDLYWGLRCFVTLGKFWGA